MKRKTLAATEHILPKPKRPSSAWRSNKDVIASLSSL